MSRAILTAEICVCSLTQLADAGDRLNVRRVQHAVTGAYGIQHRQVSSPDESMAHSAAKVNATHHYHHHYFYSMPAVPMQPQQQVFFYHQPGVYGGQTFPPGYLYIQLCCDPAYSGGHPMRRPYYSYRRPWYSPGPQTMNSMIVW
ncbi:MAG: hypothetical protein CMJ78_21080 [Planctomycetaceae bacterium]|nr:hypothetical protein [Planctomycetaceae bacterium]